MVGNFIQRTKEYLADIKENDRLIDEEIILYDDSYDNIVLVGDFLSCFGLGEEAQQTHIGRLRNKYFDEFSMRVQQVSFHLPKMMFPVGENQLTEKSKAIFEAVLADQGISVEELVEQQKQRFKEMVKRSIGVDADAPNVEVTLPENMRMIFPAMKLGYLIGQWDRVSNINRAKVVSLLKGEGQHMLAFWKAVNDLDDYSHLFPDTKGGPPDPREKAKSPATEFGAWGWFPGARPLGA